MLLGHLSEMEVNGLFLRRLAQGLASGGKGGYKFLGDAV